MLGMARTLSRLLVGSVQISPGMSTVPIPPPEPPVPVPPPEPPVPTDSVEQLEDTAPRPRPAPTATSEHDARKVANRMLGRIGEGGTHENRLFTRSVA